MEHLHVCHIRTIEKDRSECFRRNIFRYETFANFAITKSSTVNRKLQIRRNPMSNCDITLKGCLLNSDVWISVQLIVHVNLIIFVSFKLVHK